MHTTSTGMSEDCISYCQNSNEIKKEVKNGKHHDAFFFLRKQPLEYPKNVIFGHLNINSLRNKFVSISELIKGKIDIFLINEIKLDESFPSNQFAITAWKVSKPGVIFGPYFPAFPAFSRSTSPYSVRMRENTDQKKLRTWTLFTQCMSGYKKIEKNLRLELFFIFLANCQAWLWKLRNLHT